MAQKGYRIANVNEIHLVLQSQTYLHSLKKVWLYTLSFWQGGKHYLACLYVFEAINLEIVFGV